MDKLDQYRQIIQKIIHHYANSPNNNNPIESIAVCDPVNDIYMVMDIGWSDAGRVHSVPINLRIKNDRIWLEWDGTDQEIAQQLINAGVPQEDIVLAFYRPERRKLTGFALA
jgi:hypothetical protein